MPKSTKPFAGRPPAAAEALARPGTSLGHLAPLGVLIGAYLAAWFLINRGAAKRLQAEIDDVDALTKEP